MVLMVLVADLQAGISNRIKNIVSCLRMSDDVEVVWNSELHKPHNIFGTKLSDYFVNLKETNNTDNKEIRSSWRLEIFDDELPHNFSEVNQKLSKIFSRQIRPIVSDNKCIDLEYHNIPNLLKEEYKKCFNKLKINPKILNTVDKFSLENFDENTVSVHIRTWHDDMDRNEKLFDMDKFLDLMSEYNDCKFFVSTDYYPAIEYLREELGEDRIINYPHSDESIDCFIEMLLLSKNKVLIGSPMSTFTEVSWWFSGCESEVKIAWK